MNNLVKVHNLNVYPLDQVFKGQKIHIPPQKYVEMDYEEAVQFRGLYLPIAHDAGGVQKPESYKYIKIDEGDVERIHRQRGLIGNDEKKDKFVCHMCSKDFITKKGLLTHIKSKHVDAMMDEEARDELLDDEGIGDNET